MIRMLPDNWGVFGLPAGNAGTNPGVPMLALVGAAIFALALLLDLVDANLGDAFTPMTLLLAGLLCVALHLAGIGGASPVNGGWRGRGANSRR